MSRPFQLVLGSAVFLLALHAWAMFSPSHANWGIHFWGFYKPWIGIAALLVTVSFFLQRVQTIVLGKLDAIVRFFARKPVALSFIAGICLLAGGAYLFPATMHLLGDGAILIRSIPRAQWGAELLSSFRNQPLVEVIYRWIMNLWTTGASPRDVYATIDFLAGGLFVAILFWLGRNLARPPLERVLLCILLFLAAGSQFFFGYVENYVLQYVLTTAYVVAGWLALERKTSIITPILCFAILPGFSLGSLVLAPSFLFLLLWRFQTRKVLAFSIMAGIGIAGLVVLSFVGFNIIGFIEHLTQGSVDFLQPFSAIGGNFPYPMFSLPHLLDWLNALLLIFPFALPIVCFVLPTIPRSEWKTNSALQFLVIAAACGLFFTIIINPALGMARDWDMLSSFFIPLAVLSVFLLAHATVKLDPRRSMICIVVVVTVYHWAGWIGVNANADRHLARMKMLDDPRLTSLAAQMAHHEALANYFFNSSNYPEAKTYYEQYMLIDSINPRIIANISDVYRKLGDREQYFQTLLRAVRLQNPNPGIYSNLGVEFASRKDTAHAIEYNEKALALDPNQPKAHANLGILYLAKKDYNRSGTHFGKAISLGMRDPLLFRYAGDAAVARSDYDLALRYYDACLELTPNDSRVRAIRDRIRAAASK